MLLGLVNERKTSINGGRERVRQEDKLVEQRYWMMNSLQIYVD